MKKKVLAVVILLTLAGMDGLFADIITLTAPQLGGSMPNIDIGVINNELNAIVRDLQTEINRPFQGINPGLPKLIGAFADSSVFASTGASLRGYQGYKTFALTVGAVGGVQLPLNIFSLVGNIANIEGEIEELLADIQSDLDLQFGINPQILNAQLGINTRFIKGLYLGLKGGYMNLPASFFENYFGGFPLSFQTLSAGGLVNYQLIPQFRLLGGFILWRGLNLGAGFIYQSTSLDFSMSLPIDDEDLKFLIWEDTSPANLGKITGEISDPKINFGFTVNTYTVPLEAVTSFRFLGFLNTSVGVGADLGFGDARLGAGVSGDVNLNIDSGLRGLGLNVGRQGSFSATIRGESTPTLFNPKAMASLGISAGPAIILDIPITYYFLNNGLNFGITLGIAL